MQLTEEEVAIIEQIAKKKVAHVKAMWNLHEEDDFWL
jgi:hypothetical protein